MPNDVVGTNPEEKGFLPIVLPTLPEELFLLISIQSVVDKLSK